MTRRARLLSLPSASRPIFPARFVALVPAFLFGALAFGASQPRFAEDLPPGAGYAVVLRLVPDEAGVVETCTLHGVRESTPQGPAMALTPPDRYVADACRKLSQRTWKAERGADGITAVFYFCRWLESTPEMAYCERRFGD